MMKSSLIFCGLFLAASAFAQSDEYVDLEARSDDYTYRNNIRSVRLMQFDSEVDYPILELGSPAHLIFEFDDLDGDSKDYSYKIIHCNADWTPSEEIDEMDYIDGFSENRFYENETSFNTITEYTHYEVQLPNEDINWTKSGNYLLKLYLDDDEEDIVATRRFMVVDTKMKVVPQLRRSATPPFAATHHELNFSIEHSGILVGNAEQQIKIAVLQNGRWDNAITNLTPTYVRNESIVYDQAGKILFPALREFRPLDLRTYRNRGPQVEWMRRTPDKFEIVLFPDRARHSVAYLFTNDLNGRYLIKTFDENNDKIKGEYGEIEFTLQTPKRENGEVYVIGGFTEWQAYERFRMTYDDEEMAYKAKILIKNGFYDFMYGFISDVDNSGSPDYMTLEGSSYETENDYLFLVYYREFGGRYDQLVAVQKLNSNPR